METLKMFSMKLFDVCAIILMTKMFHNYFPKELHRNYIFFSKYFLMIKET